MRVHAGSFQNQKSGFYTDVVIQKTYLRETIHVS